MAYQSMMFKDSYPHLEQWLMYGGTLNVYSIGNGVITVEVGDGEGLSDDYIYESETIDEGLLAADEQVKALINEARELQSMYLLGDVKSADQEIICITGLPPIRNPFFNNNR
ncbi:MAG TPA: hypothetical protein VIM41_14990 [Gammaproteobacteria bacterium]